MAHKACQAEEASVQDGPVRQARETSQAQRGKPRPKRHTCRALEASQGSQGKPRGFTKRAQEAGSLAKKECWAQKARLVHKARGEASLAAMQCQANEADQGSRGNQAMQAGKRVRQTKPPSPGRVHKARLVSRKAGWAHKTSQGSQRRPWLTRQALKLGKARKASQV